MKLWAVTVDTLYEIFKLIVNAETLKEAESKARNFVHQSGVPEDELNKANIYSDTVFFDSNGVFHVPTNV